MFDQRDTVLFTIFLMPRIDSNILQNIFYSEIKRGFIKHVRSTLFLNDRKTGTTKSHGVTRLKKHSNKTCITKNYLIIQTRFSTLSHSRDVLMIMKYVILSVINIMYTFEN